MSIDQQPRYEPHRRVPRIRGGFLSVRASIRASIRAGLLAERRIRWFRVLVAAIVTHLAANTLMAIVLLLPGAVPVRDALTLPILLVVGTVVTARWAARDASTSTAGTHGALVGGCVGAIALAYGPYSALLTGVLAVVAGWLGTTRSTSPH